VSSDKLFARKFDTSRSLELLMLIDERIHKLGKSSDRIGIEPVEQD
jgi:hypothetical protein